MKLVLLFVDVVLASAYGYTINTFEDQTWEEFKVKFSKEYGSPSEELRRKLVFQENVENVEQHNRKYYLGLVTHKAGINHLSDMTADEVIKTMTGINLISVPRSHVAPIGTFKPTPNVTYPAEFDWRTKGAVTPVKNQRQCGSCWAFSSTGSLEGQVFRKTGKLLSLSEQNLVDCSRRYGNYGCNGGWMDDAFQYIQDNNGIDSESSYPYEAVDGTCRYSASQKVATDSGFYDVRSGDEQALMQAVATVGPISVVIQVTNSFIRYRSGVSYDSNCAGAGNHAVLVVGYGDDATGGPYWLVKNSWATSYGDEGYIKMARNRGNNCGIATYATYPKV